MKNGTLLIFSGLPGSGKSTLAAKGLKEICDIAHVDGIGYRLSYRIARENLQLGNVVIANSVNVLRRSAGNGLVHPTWSYSTRQVGARMRVLRN